MYLLLEMVSFQLAMFTESMSGFVSGYRLEAKQCAKNVCTCDYGTAVTGAACPLAQPCVLSLGGISHPGGSHQKTM